MVGNANGKLYFAGHDDANGEELWSYDPTAVSDACESVSDIREGPADSKTDESNLAVMGTLVFFTAISLDDASETSPDGHVGQELRKLYVNSGTVSVACDAKIGGSGNPRNLFSVDGDPPTLYFTATGPTADGDDGGDELWKYTPGHGTPSDPVIESCKQVCDLRTGPIGSNIQSFTWFKGKLWMIAKPDTGLGLSYKLAVYDPSSEQCSHDIYDGSFKNTKNRHTVASADHLYMFTTTDHSDGYPVAYNVVRTDGVLANGKLQATTIFSTTKGNFENVPALFYSYTPTAHTTSDGASGLHLSGENAQLSFGLNTDGSPVCTIRKVPGELKLISTCPIND